MVQAGLSLDYHVLIKEPPIKAKSLEQSE